MISWGALHVCIILVVILFFRLLIYSWRNKKKRNTNCPREKEAINILLELTNKMNVKLHPTKLFEIVPDFKGASSLPRPFLTGCKVHFGGTVRVGCTILCCIDNLALKGVLAHELAHILKKHSLRALPSLLVLLPVLVYGFISNSFPIIPFLLAIPVGILILSFISWHHEYEADAIASGYVGKKDMVYSLQQFAGLIYRPGDTLIHPSFKKRISRLLANE